MASAAIDSDLFQDIFGTHDARQIFSDKSHEQYNSHIALSAAAFAQTRFVLEGLVVDPGWM